MTSITSVPVTAAVFAALTILLSVSIAYDAIGPMVETGTPLALTHSELAMAVDR